MVLNLSAGLFIFVALLGLIDSFLGLNFDFSEYCAILNFTKISFQKDIMKLSNLNENISTGSNLTAKHFTKPNNWSLFWF